MRPLDRVWRFLRRPEGLVLALGGGGARGIAHVAILETLEEAGIPVAGIAGTSAGALVGAMWLRLGSAEATLTRWRSFLASGFPGTLPDVRLTEEVTTRDNLLLQFARRVRRGAAVILALERRSLVDPEDFQKALELLLPEGRIEDLRLPFCAVATDFETGRTRELRSGSLHRAVTASSAVPGVLPPVLLDGHHLIDGGVVADVPVCEARRLSPRPVVAVDVGEVAGPQDFGTITVPRAILRADILTHSAFRAVMVRGADLVLRPEVGAIHWSEFIRLEEAFEAGRKAAREALPGLRALASRPWSNPRSGSVCESGS